MSSTPSLATDAREFRFYGGADQCCDIVNLEQVVHGNADRVLHDGSHVNEVLIAGKELRSERFGAAEHAIGDIAANDGALRLTNLQLGGAIDGPWQRNVQARHDPRLDNAAEARDHRLLVRGHDVDACRQPPDEHESGQPAPVLCRLAAE